MIPRCLFIWSFGSNFLSIIAYFFDGIVCLALSPIRWTFTDGITGKSWFELQISLEIDIILSEMTYIKSKYS